MTWVAAGVASAAATAAGVKYIKGRRDAKKDAKNRPVYSAPKEAEEALALSRQQAQQGVPEAVKQQYYTDLERSSAGALSGIASRKGGLSGIAAVNQNQNDAYANMASMDAQARMQNKGALINHLSQFADYRDQEFQLNKINPYYEKIAQRRGNDQELFQGLSNSMSVFAGGAGGMGGMGGGSKSAAPSGGGGYGSGYGTNPYGNVNIGTYNNPNTAGMFTQSQNNAYGQNTGTYLNPNTSGMFKSVNKNPYY